MQKIVPTQASNVLQTHTFTKIPFVVVPNTTLNQKFNILQDRTPPPGIFPGLEAYTIGIGGHGYETGAQGIPLGKEIEHYASHTGLYKHLPFVLRPLLEDLSTAERARFALRTQIEVEGSNYWAYYAKRIDMTGARVEQKLHKVEGGVETITEFVPSEADLSPPPPVIPNTAVVTTSGEYLSASTIVPIPWNEWDVKELLNAARILFGDERYAVVSEFGFLTGVNSQVMVNTPGGQVQFNEIIAAQICTFVGGKYEMIYNTQGFDFRLELGATQPLLGAEQIPTITGFTASGYNSGTPGMTT